MAKKKKEKPPPRKLRADEIADQAVRAYFRRFGKGAEQPNKNYTEIVDIGGNPHIQLGNVRRTLATYRIETLPSGARRLRYVEERD